MTRHQLLRRAEQARAARSGDPLHDLAVFAGLLRTAGLGVSPAASLQAMRALTFVRLEQRRDFRSALECCLTSSAEDRAAFDAVYDTFWSANGARAIRLGAAEDSSGSDSGRGEGGTLAPDAGSAPDGRPDQRGLAGRAAYSRRAGKGGQVTARPRREIDDLCRRLARAVGTRPGRRFVGSTRGEAVDLRASLRHNLRFGEELLLLQHTARRRDRPRIVVLCDVSSSMLSYTPLFLTFTHSLTKLVRQVESAVFNVELAIVTEVFRRTALHQALRWLEHQQVALSGGTRIGHCLHGFLDHLEHRSVTGPGTIALILSDGWDVGDARLLQDGMRRLHGQVARVVWCDPHAAASGYRPQVRGLQLALPYVDDYLEFSTVASLSQLVTRLEAGSGPAAGRDDEGSRHLPLPNR